MIRPPEKGTVMSEANKQLMKRWFEQVWNQQREAAIDEMFAADGKSHGLPEPDSVLEGPKDFKGLHRTFCGTFPDLHVTVEDVIAEGEHVAVRWSVTMTHLGDGLGFPATGKKVQLRGSSFDVIKDGKIVEGWNQTDMAAMIAILKAQ
jgi:steroid delta-isomerase-like uncharacterized protein